MADNDAAQSIASSIARLFEGAHDDAEPAQHSDACPTCGQPSPAPSAGPVDPNSNMGKMFKGTRKAFGNE